MILDRNWALHKNTAPLHIWITDFRFHFATPNRTEKKKLNIEVVNRNYNQNSYKNKFSVVVLFYFLCARNILCVCHRVSKSTKSLLRRVKEKAPPVTAALNLTSLHQITPDQPQVTEEVFIYNHNFDAFLKLN